MSRWCVLPLFMLGAAALCVAQDSPEKILLKDYRPQSTYRIPRTNVTRAKFRVIDVHSHAYARTAEEIDRWVATMDEAGIEKTLILTGATGEEFDRLNRMYSKHPDRFELWCGFDYTGYEKPGFGPAAVKELERCVRAGARGVGELSDKGQGMHFGEAFARGMHPDDARMDPLFEKCGELGIPVNLHVADPIWMYQKMDATNDGLMNAWQWRLDNQPDIVGHAGMVEILERAAKRHPRTTFIACHFANLDYDLARLGELFDRNPNLYADISARYAETAPIPRFASAFITKYSGRLLYGTDMGFDPAMYRTTFRILESLDEHFYEHDLFGYHWALNGFGLPDAVLKRLYRDNAIKVRAKK
ncbi:MAG TPA: amidohydrolase family protein [Bryobacteraceae bacterium]|nr:amidohydrolase family protein [Bryobacteraceae bacterium]